MTDPKSEPSELRAAAQAVVERWDAPLWKNVPATAVFINRLRAALTLAPAQPDHIVDAADMAPAQPEPLPAGVEPTNLLRQECDDADAVLQAFGLDPETFRTEGGRLNLLKIRAAVREPFLYRHEDVCGDEVGPPTKLYITPPTLTDADQKELAVLREFAGGRCAIQKVIEQLGPMSLWSKDAFEREVAKRAALTDAQCDAIHFGLSEWAKDIDARMGLPRPDSKSRALIRAAAAGGA